MINVSAGPAPCRLCSVEEHWLGDHLAEVHDLTLDAYLEQFPDAPTCSAVLVGRYKKRLTHPSETAALDELRAAPTDADVQSLNVEFAGLKFPVNLDVPAEDCLPMPEHYKIPSAGRLAADVQDAVIALKRNRSIWVWGPPGTGKDAVFSALCAMTRRPSLLFTVVQGADITAWKYTRSFDAEGTSWEEGLLLRALRDGYTTRDGRVIPYLIVLSDFDRATRQQAEELRQILDSIQGRITGPTGEVWPTMPGTTIVATANSSGAGDTTGRCISANPIDASILDRFERKIKFHSMDVADEKEILGKKFPVLAARFPEAMDEMMNATKAVREAVVAEVVYGEWSHRTLCAWAGAAEDLLETLPGAFSTEPKTEAKVRGMLLRRAARVVLDGLPDSDTREGVKNVMDAHIKGGFVNPGDTSHVDPGGLKANDW